MTKTSECPAVSELGSAVISEAALESSCLHVVLLFKLHSADVLMRPGSRFQAAFARQLNKEPQRGRYVMTSGTACETSAVSSASFGCRRKQAGVFNPWGGGGPEG